MAPGKSSP